MWCYWRMFCVKCVTLYRGNGGPTAGNKDVLGLTIAETRIDFYAGIIYKLPWSAKVLSAFALSARVLGIILGQLCWRRAEEVLVSMNEFRMTLSASHGLAMEKLPIWRGCLKNQAQVQQIIKEFGEYYLASANQYKALDVTQYIV